MSTAEVFAVDAFVRHECLGNIAGVCVPSADLTEVDFQGIAARFGAPETAFVFKKDKRFEIRWFTPEMEVDLCGHATLAAAALIWRQEESLSLEEITFESKSGSLHCRKSEEGLIELDFPALPVVEASPEPGLLTALGIQRPLFVGKSENYFLIEANDVSTVLKLSPRFDLMKLLDSAGVFVTAKSAPPFDFVSRCFFPKEGIPEDPVTGSAHCSLGPYWRKKLSKDVLRARQVSSRGGDIRITFKNARVILGGRVRIHPGSVIV
ncbi:MAG: PhzF family phenazine biosynthesis protein [Oligoflexia bacterium]|nr:PhzF family phenazine biosynthesis protein [Oligoflexia bacterium]